MAIMSAGALLERQARSQSVTCGNSFLDVNFYGGVLGRESIKPKAEAIDRIGRGAK